MVPRRSVPRSVPGVTRSRLIIRGNVERALVLIVRVSIEEVSVDICAIS